MGTGGLRCSLLHQRPGNAPEKAAGPLPAGLEGLCVLVCSSHLRSCWWLHSSANPCACKRVSPIVTGRIITGVVVHPLKCSTCLPEKPCQLCPGPHRKASVPQEHEAQRCWRPSLNVSLGLSFLKDKTCSGYSETPTRAAVARPVGCWGAACFPVLTAPFHWDNESISIS